MQRQISSGDCSLCVLIIALYATEKATQLADFQWLQQTLVTTTPFCGCTVSTVRTSFAVSERMQLVHQFTNSFAAFIVAEFEEPTHRLRQLTHT